jgi:restriction system protein
MENTNAKKSGGPPVQSPTQRVSRLGERIVKSGGIQNTLVYWLAVDIYYLNHIFINKYIPKNTRTHDQMEQAGRSGKQDLVEGSLENSTESNLKLSGVSRASYGELVEDYIDFLWKKGLKVWDKNDPRVMSIRRRLIDIHETHVPNEAHEFHGIQFSDPEAFANLMITLCTKEGFLMDKFLKGIENRFVKEGGFRENLYKKRFEYKNNPRKY